MKARPARQSFSVGGARAIEVDANGDVVVFAHEKVVVHRWSTGKTEKYPWGEMDSRHWASLAALLGNEAIVAATWGSMEGRQDYAIYSREPFEQRRVFSSKGTRPARDLIASPDGTLFAIVGGEWGDGPAVGVFTADGDPVQAIESLAVSGVMFSDDSKELICFCADAVYRFPIGAKKPSGFVACEMPDWGGSATITPNDGKLLVAWNAGGATRPAYVFDQATLKLLASLDAANVYSWGPNPGTLVRSVRAEVELVDLTQMRLATFRRDRTPGLYCAAPHPSGFWCAGGAFLEIYDFNRLTEVASGARPHEKKRAASKPPKPLVATKDELADGDALLAKIWADPDDEDALKVYADWLCEHGAETRGQYVQLMLSRDLNDELQKRAKTLVKRHRGEWLGAARPFVRSWGDASWPPGFVEYVVCEASKLLEGFEQIVKLGPSLQLTVTAISKKRRETEKKLAALPFNRFTHVNLAMNGLDDVSLSTLAPALKGVVALGLQNNPFTAEGLAALGRHGGPFEELSLFVGHRAPSGVTKGYVEVLITLPAFAKLRRLHFGGVHPNRPAPHLPVLRNKLKHLEELIT
jgi:uncharacterized protein (TIGR02996 family)